MMIDFASFNNIKPGSYIETQYQGFGKIEKIVKDIPSNPYIIFTNENGSRHIISWYDSSQIVKLGNLLLDME